MLCDLDCRRLRARFSDIRQYGLTVLVDLEIREIVGSSLAPVDNGDRFAELRRVSREPVTGKHHQRRPDDEQGVALLYRGGRRINSALRHVLAEKNDVRFDDVSTGATARYDEAVVRNIIELHVSVRFLCQYFRAPLRVRRRHTTADA